MAGYIGSKASVVSSGAERKKTFAISTTTTSLTGLSYTPTYVHVFHNGVRLVDGSDFTATNGTSITLSNSAVSGDEVVVISYSSFQVADHYNKTESDTRFINTAGDTLTGTLGGTAVNLSGDLAAVNTTLTGYLRGPSSFTIDPATHTDDTGLVIIAGNLQVDGSTTTINSTTLTVNDLNLTLANGAADSAAANGAGITIDGASASLLYSHSGTKFVFNKPLDVTGNVVTTGSITAPTLISGAYGGSGSAGDGFRLNSTDLYGQIDASDKVRLTVNGDSFLNGGNLGIGTPSPGELLHVQRASGTTMVKTEVAANSVVGFNIKKTGTTTKEWKIVDGQTVNGVLEVYDVTNSKSIMSFNSTGSIGIGGVGAASTMDARATGGLHLANSTGISVQSTSAQTNSRAWRIRNDDLTDWGSLNFAVGTNNSDYADASTDVVMTMLRSGNVGIGDDAPQDFLEVRSTSLGGITISNANHNQAALSFARSSTATARVFITEPNAAHTSAMHFQTSDASGSSPNLITAMSIDDSQNVGIGTTPHTGWYGNATALQIATTGALYNTSNWEDLNLANNVYINTSGVDSYIQNDAACKIRLTDAGLIDFRVAGAGTAGNAISWDTAFSISALGRVGVGLTQADPVKFEVSSDTDEDKVMRIRFKDDNNSNATANPFSYEYKNLEIENTYSGAAPSANGTKVAKLQLTTVTSGGYAASGSIMALATSTGYDSGELVFLTGSNSSGLETERMRISRLGNVGIGTTAGEGPSTQLSVHNPSQSWNQYSTLRLSTEDETNHYGEISYHRGTGSEVDKGLVFGYSGSEKMRILHNGNVGIGTALPEAPLDITPNPSTKKTTRVHNATQHGYQEYVISGLIGANAVTITMQCPSYFQSEVVATFQQSNGGSDNNVYFNGIWSNNHTSHLFKNKTDGGTVPRIGSLGSATPAFTVGVGDAASNTGKLTFTKAAATSTSGTYCVHVRAYGYGCADMTYVVS